MVTTMGRRFYAWWTTGDLRRLREMRAAGATWAECARAFGRHRWAVEAFGRRHGLARPAYTFAGRRDACAALAAAGYSGRSAAEALGVAQSTVYYWSKRWGLRWCGAGKRNAGRAAV
jgi:transcriptional regulator with GAF, ATPase, and Fis domain